MEHYLQLQILTFPSTVSISALFTHPFNLTVMKSAIVVSAFLVAASAVSIPRAAKRSFHESLLLSIHKRDLAVVKRATDTYGNYIGSSEGCWVPNCNDYYGGTWIGSGPEPYSPEWFSANGMGVEDMNFPSIQTGSTGSTGSTDSTNSADSIDTGSTSSPSVNLGSSCSSECSAIMTAADACTTSTDMYCGCDIILSTGQACSDCFQPLNATVSTIILNGMQTCLAHESTGSTGSTGTTTPSVTGTALGGQTVKPSATTTTKTTGSAVPVKSISGAERVYVAGVVMAFVGLVAGVLF